MRPNRKKLFSFTTESMGVIDCFRMTLGDEMTVLKQLKKEIHNCTPDDYVRTLISVACENCPEATGMDVQSDLSIVDAGRLSDTEVEDFARKYIEANDWLYREHISKTEPVENGEGTKISLNLGELAYPKFDDESYVGYLHRLMVLAIDRTTKSVSKAAQLASKQIHESFRHFSTGLQSQISQVMKMGDKLRSRVEAIRPQAISVEPFRSSLNSIDFDELAKISAEKQLAPFKYLASQLEEPLNALSIRLDKLAELTAESSDFLVEVNKTQTKLADDLKASSKTNIWLSIIVISLTCLSLVFSWLAVRGGMESTTDLLRGLDKHADRFETALRKLPADLNPNISKDQIEKAIEQQGLILRELQSIRSSIGEENKKTGSPPASTTTRKHSK